MEPWTPFILLVCTAANLTTCWFMGRLALKKDRQDQLETAIAELRTQVADMEDAMKKAGLVHVPIFSTRRKNG